MVKTHTRTTYESDKAPGYVFTFEPDEDSIIVEETKEGSTVKYITRDPDAQSPREMNENLGTMVCLHTRYNLGDRDHGFRSEDYDGWEAMEKAADAFLLIPIYMYDHSGLTINTTGFSCPWDSGRLGFIYVSKDKVKKEYGNLGHKTMETVKKVLLGEVEEYNRYLRGEVYGIVAEKFTSTKEPIDHDACWGFFGEEYAKEALKTEL